ncbi:MAG TPA: hypothetical protein VH186_03275 [Chloroflexia bacterium]|nr:hypothetical protein [Chloroflexia bacterium]
MTAKGLIKGAIALAIIVAGALIGWALATSTNPNNQTASSANTPAVAAAATRPTPLPTFTPIGGASASGANNAQAGTNAGTNTNGSTQTGANANGSAQTGANSQAGSGARNGGFAGRASAVTATIDSYDDSAKVLTVKDSTGKTDKYGTSNARITKSEKITQDAFSKLLSGNGIVIVTGEKSSDGSINATALTVTENNGFGGGQGRAAGGNGAQGQAGGTPGQGRANATGTPGQGRAAGNGGGFFGGQGGANAPTVIRGATIQGNKLTGTSFTGENVTVNLSDTTTYEQQVAGTTADLKVGQGVTITARAAQADAPAEAVNITLMPEAKS